MAAEILKKVWASLDVVDIAKEAHPLLKVLAGVGFLLVANVAHEFLHAIYNYFLRPPKDLRKMGKWACVTGATDGIGKAYSFAFAKQGLNVVLISRTESKLKDVQAEIKAKYGSVEIKYVVCDYSKFNDAAVRSAVAKELQGLEIGVLVNNVGLGYRYPRFFHELPDQEVQDLLTLNIDSAVWMTRMVLPGMLERKRGAIVNMSSGSAMHTLPLLAEYSGAKSFLEKFSRAINREYKTRNITCQCQIPYYVATKLAKMRKSLTVPEPHEYVNYAMRWIGYPDAAIAQPFWLHGVIGAALGSLPDWIVGHIIMNLHMATRAKGLKKDAKEAGKKE